MIYIYMPIGKVYVGVNIETQVVYKVEMLSQLTGRTKADFIRDALDEYVKKMESEGTIQERIKRAEDAGEEWQVARRRKLVRP